MTHQRTNDALPTNDVVITAAQQDLAAGEADHARAFTAGQVIELRLDELKPHPRQAELFPDFVDGEIEALAADMKDRGQQDPIEVTPEMTIITGHQRVAAARANGWPTVKAVVRHDLAAMGDVAVEQHMIRSNLVRRHMSRLGKARAAKRLVQLAAQQSSRRGRVSRTQVREGVGKMLAISSREVSRLLAVLEAPAEIQEAFEASRISLVAAGKVASMSARQQKDVIAKLKRGTQSASPGGSKRIKSESAYLRLLAELDELVPRLSMLCAAGGPPCERSEIRAATLDDHITTLCRLAEMERESQASVPVDDAAQPYIGRRRTAKMYTEIGDDLV